MKRTTARRKAKRQRGYNSHGWGHKKKHRGAGSRGGRGNAGSGKRADTKKPSIINTYGTANLSRSGFRSPTFQPYESINVGDLQRMAEQGAIGKEIKLEELGYKKLLGSGSIHVPLTIHVPLASARAVEKIKRAGGDVVGIES